MWKFIKYSFNKAFEKNLLNLIIFFIALSFIGVFIISSVIFLLQKIGLLSQSNFFIETLWQGFNLFFDQNEIFDLDGDKNNFFDLILCNHVLEHIVEDKLAMMEIYRVLKPNGTAVLQVPIETSNSKTLEETMITSQKERNEKFGQYDHVRLYGNDYFKRLESIGFKVEKNFYAKKFNKEEIKKYGLNENEIIPICKKLI